MRIAVFGAGAVGSVLGGMLAKSSVSVTLLGRPWHLDVVRQSGLVISGLWGEAIIRNLDLATSPSEVRDWSTQDMVFVCVKSYDTESAAQALARVLGPKTFVCAFQNGLGNYETLVRWLDPARVLLGRIIFGAEIEPGRVRVTVCADDVLIGSPDSRVSPEICAQLASLLRTSGVPARTTTRIMEELWMKAIYNCALNALSTILEVPYGRLLESDATRTLIRLVIEEAYQVAKLQKIALDPPTAEGYQTLLFERLIPDTATHHASMLQDIRRGKRTEIHDLNGALVRLGTQHGVAVPVNALLTQFVHAKECLTSVRCPLT